MSIDESNVPLLESYLRKIYYNKGWYKWAIMKNISGYYEYLKMTSPKFIIVL